jgi:hypothetical protein
MRFGRRQQRGTAADEQEDGKMREAAFLFKIFNTARAGIHLPLMHPIAASPGPALRNPDADNPGMYVNL